MARVNLLPWREEQRVQRKTEYLTVVGICAAIALLVWGAVHWHFNERIDYQKSRNEFLQAEISANQIRNVLVPPSWRLHAKVNLPILSPS